MAMPFEPVTIQRTALTVPALIDPSERRLYFGTDVDVRADDVAGFRGYTRQITEMPQLWFGAGVVATFEDAPTTLPDLGELYRASAGGVVDEDTGELDITASTPAWSGACLVEPAQSDGSNPEIGDQPVGVVPFTVEVPLSVVDVRPGDVFKVTQSRDQRLLVRTLVVKAVRASSSAQVRTFLAFDNQGG